MNTELDLELTKLTVRLSNPDSKQPIGSGIIYSNQQLKDKVYILTAGHCLFDCKDKDTFQNPLQSINIDFYNSEEKRYDTISHDIDYELVSAKINPDVAVLILDKEEVEKITGEIPTVKAIKTNRNVDKFILKGFPSATDGEEIDTLRLSGFSHFDQKDIFQLTLDQDYSDEADSNYQVDGFSGSGVFLLEEEELYLFGILTRFRDAGKVFHVEYVKSANKLLQNNFKEAIRFEYFAEKGLNKEFFEKNVNLGLENLGKRFNRDFNINLSINNRFSELTRNIDFKNKLIFCLDDFLEETHKAFWRDNDVVAKCKNKHEQFYKELSVWRDNLSFEGSQEISTTGLVGKIENCFTIFEEERRRIHVSGIPNKESSSNQYSNPNLHESELYAIRRAIESYELLESRLNSVNFDLVNSPILLINGEAGSGKSHLLGNLAKERNANSRPTLLFVGQLFQGSKSIWEDIFGMIDWKHGKSAFLENLDEIGQQTGERVLILIDAINEGAGRELWRDQIENFVNELKDYKSIALVLTIRSDYYEYVLPQSFRDNVTTITHKGFEGSEYEAVKAYCNHYGLHQPSIPLLSPECTNGLFLHIICQVAQNRGEKTFPTGLQGQEGIFQGYLKYINQAIEDKREEYYKEEVVKKAMKLFIKEDFKARGKGVFKKNKVRELFRKKFPQFPHLLNDLLQENILMENLTDSEQTRGEQEEHITFAYQRLGDWITADRLLSKYKTADEVKEACSKDRKLGRFVHNYGYWRYAGVLNVLAILLPERFNLEIVEAYDWVLSLEETDRHNSLQDLTHILLESLKWRNLNERERDKIVEFLKKECFPNRDRGKHNLYTVTEDDYIFHITESTTIHSHAFNSDYFHFICSSRPLPQRDGFLQRIIDRYSGDDDDGNPLPLRRLIDWAWTPHISEKVDEETARLAGQTLIWLLSSTNRKLRDQTTKALVCLLQELPDVLIGLLEKFKNIDDPYISERLYAVAYGCALRTEKEESLQEIAQYTYDRIFKEGNPPVHILLRDYARCTVEYALHRKLNIKKLSKKKLRPPYGSSVPEYPTEEEISQYYIDKGESKEGVEKHDEFTHNRIHTSVMTWDFGEKIVRPIITKFENINFKLKEDVESFKGNLNKKKLELLALHQEIASQVPNKAKMQLLEKKMDGFNMDKHLKLRKEVLKNVEKEIVGCFKSSELVFFEKRYKLYLQQLKKEDNGRHLFQSKPIKEWIVKKAFELGYDTNLHGEYDKTAMFYRDRGIGFVERIGKKYQWIAFHEVMARLSDNYRYKISSFQPIIVQGPWEFYKRDIDVSFLCKTRNVNNNYNPKIYNDTSWFSPPKYDYWNQELNQWIINKSDLSMYDEIILRKKNNEDWLCLKEMKSWKKKDSHKNQQERDVFHNLHAYLLFREDKKQVLSWLEKEESFAGKIENGNGATNLMSREAFWSPLWQENEERYINDIRFGSVTVESASVFGAVEMSSDKSDASYNYLIPCKEIFEGLDLKYGYNEGELFDKKNNLISVGTEDESLFVRKDKLCKFLESSGLDIIWLLYGEKFFYDSDFFSGASARSEIKAYYYLEDGEIKSNLSIQLDE